MTLKTFQIITKVSFVVTVLVSYGIGSYFLGKFSVGNNILKVKGVSANVNRNDIIEKPLPYADVQVPEVISSSVKSCSNTTYGFEIVYPSDWFTTYNTEDQQCNFFAPYSFVLPYEIVDNVTPITIELIDPANWQTTLEFYENPNELYNVVSSQNDEINGKLVKKIIAQSTGSTNIPRGFAILHYLVFDGNLPMRFTYSQLDINDNVENNKRVLEDIVNSLKLF